MTRVAAIDCGTNSIRLLIADVDRSNGAHATHRRACGKCAWCGWARALTPPANWRPRPWNAPLRPRADYAALIREHRAPEGPLRRHVRHPGRRATARSSSTASASLLGVEPEVITGDEEAALSFAGASSVLPALGEDPVLVVDLGGGSTEFVLGDADGVHCRRVRGHRLRPDDRTPPAQRSAHGGTDRRGGGRRRRRHRRGATGRFRWNAAPPSSGVAGSITTITAHALRLPEYLPAAIHGTELSPGRDPGSAAPICWNDPGASGPHCRTCTPAGWTSSAPVRLVWRRVLQPHGRAHRRAASLRPRASEHDILDGIALRCPAERPTRARAPSDWMPE